MKHGAFQKFYQDTEDMVKKTINMKDLPTAQTSLLQTICSVDTSYTTSQLRMLFRLVFKL